MPCLGEREPEGNREELSVVRGRIPLDDRVVLDSASFRTPRWFAKGVFSS